MLKILPTPTWMEAKNYKKSSFLSDHHMLLCMYGQHSRVHSGCTLSSGGLFLQMQTHTHTHVHAHTHAYTHAHTHTQWNPIRCLKLGLGFSHFLTLTLYRQSADVCIHNLNDDGTMIRPCPARGASLFSKRTLNLFFSSVCTNSIHVDGWLPFWHPSPSITVLTLPRVWLSYFIYYMCNSSKRSLWSLWHFLVWRL